MSPSNSSDCICRNCTTCLRGPYCHRCGQRARSRIAPLPTLVQEAVRELFNLDTRLLRTLARLLFVPGQLTREYLSARRRRYVPPLRLFVFFSFVLFLVVGLSQGHLLGTTDENTTPLHVTVDTTNAEQASPDAQHTATFFMIPEEARDSLRAFVDEARHKTDLKNQFLHAAAQGVLRTTENPDRFMDRVVGRLSVLAFVMLPVFALLLKLLYVGTGRLYAEHLILALHLHAFLFVLLLFMVAANLAGIDFMADHGTELLRWTLLIYVFIALKRVYRQSWGGTLTKVMVLLISYVVALTIGFGIYLFITLLLS